MIKKRLLLSGLFILIFLLPFELVLLNEQLANYLHRELTYEYISQKLTYDLENDLDKTMMLSAYVFLNEMEYADSLRAVDKDVHFDLVRSVGWCDQKCNGLIHLLAKQNIKSRMHLFDCHTVAEVWIDDVPVFIDPTYHLYFVDKERTGDIAGMEDVLYNNSNLISNKRMPFAEYPESYLPDCALKTTTRPLLDELSFSRKVLSTMMSGYNFLFGSIFRNALQDFYFFCMKTLNRNSLFQPVISAEGFFLDEFEKEEFQLIFKARSMQLLGRKKAAKTILQSLDTSAKQAYYLAILAKELGDEEGFASLSSFIQMESNQAEEVMYLQMLQEYLEKLSELSVEEKRALFN